MMPYCQFCGNQRDWVVIDYDLSLLLGQLHLVNKYWYEDGVTKQLICKDCAVNVKKEMGLK